MIFPKCTLKKTDPRFQCHCRPFGHPVEFRRIRNMLDCIIYIFNDFSHNKFSGIPGLHQIFIIRCHRFIVPGNITEALYFLKIKVRSEKTCNTVILFPNSRIGATLRMFQIKIYITQISPIPSATGSRDRS